MSRFARATHPVLIAITLRLGGTALAADSTRYVSPEPQLFGWPLTPEERVYVIERAEHERRPGSESGRHLPQLWPIIASAGHFGGDAWLKLHEQQVTTAEANRGPIDVLLVGDSITIQWGEAWARNFPHLRTVNMGIGGDKTQNVLWRLNHGGADGLRPKVVVVLIGNNNMFFTPETGVTAVADGIKAVIDNVRGKFPASAVICVSILPAHEPGMRFYEDIMKTNAVLEGLRLDRDSAVHRLDLTADFLAADGTLKPNLYAADRVHLSQAGYDLYASRLRPLLLRLLGH
jgi:beta-glucosidase